MGAWVFRIQCPPSRLCGYIPSELEERAIPSQCPHLARASHWSARCILGLYGGYLAGQGTWSGKDSPAGKLPHCVPHFIKLHFLRSQHRIVNLRSELLNSVFLRKRSGKDRWWETADGRYSLLTSPWTWGNILREGSGFLSLINRGVLTQVKRTETIN